LCGWPARKRISGLNPKAGISNVKETICRPLIAETRRRVVGDRRAMAEPGSIEGKTGNFPLARTTFLQTLEANGITKAHDVHAHITREQHSSRTPQ
jgi:hypothetical protein